MKSAWPGLAILLLLPLHSASARPQQQGDSSIADAARRTREQKKEQPKSAKVWDNDTIPKKPGDVSVIGPSAAAPDDSAAAAPAGAADGSTAPADANAAPPAAQPAPAADSDGADKSEPSKAAAELAAIQTDLAAAKSNLQTAKTDLDVLQRKFTLDSQTYYSKPNYVADKDGGARIDAEKADVDAKQQEVADAQMKVDQLEAKLAAVR
ncbi:MAG: hypothetical protein ACRD59_04100 [Candidatus Acidiferrales bacterium]